MDVIKKIRNYTLNERHCLGQGSFGKVYEAMSDQGRKVAIKKVDQMLIISDRYLKQSLDNEISIMQKLRHPNIVQLYEVITTANNIYLIMQFCSGGDLKRFCSTRKVNEEMALNIIRQIAQGFEEMSKSGIIHRDLKPANILVNGDLFKICDFGFAKYFGEAGRMAKTFVGTPIYMSPQVLNQKHYTNKTDVWSLGVMLFELLFGRLPYSGYSEQQLYRNIMKRPLQIPECSKLSLKLLQGMLIVQQSSRWGWEEVFDTLFNRSPGINRVRSNTPGNNNVMFYGNEQRGKEEKKVEKKEYEQPHGRTPPAVTNNNYLDNVYEPAERAERAKQEHIRRAQQGKNMLIPQEGNRVEEEPYMPPPPQMLIQPEKIPEENPRFFYFILVEFIVNPIQGSISFDSFIFTLWKYTIFLYQKLLEKPDVNNVQLYRNVLMNEMNELRNLQGQLAVKKQGNLRNLAEIVFQQSKVNPTNKKKIVWLKRFIDRKYTYEVID